jgi:membrane fusion protein, multidrug efflux system
VTENTAIGKHGRKRVYQALLFLLATFILVFAYWFIFMRGRVFSDDARIDGNLVDLAPQIPGVLLSVIPAEGSRVEKGQILFELDRQLLQSALVKAEADAVSSRASLDVARAQYEKAINGPLKDEIHIAQADAEKAAAALHLAELSWLRLDGLYKRDALSALDRDRAQEALQATRDNYKSASNRLSLLEQGTRSEDLAAAKSAFEVKKAEVQSSEARLAQARISLDYAQVRAPFSGVVVRRWRDPGATLAAGTPVLTVLDPSTLYVSANIDEKYLHRIAIGDRVDISVDAYPDVSLTGRLQEILRATNSQFSLIPAEGTSGTFIKVAQRIPLRISIDGKPGIPLGPGLSVEVKIFSGSHGR